MQEHAPRQKHSPGEAGQGFVLRLGTLSSPTGLQLLCLLTEATADALRAGQIYPRNETHRGLFDDPDLGRLEAELGGFVRRVYAEISPALLRQGPFERQDVDRALLECALQWVDLQSTNAEISRREWQVTQAVVAGLTERSADMTLRLRAAKSLHRLIDESLWWDFRFARYAGTRIVQGFVDQRWSCGDFDHEQLEQIYTSIQIEGESESGQRLTDKSSFFHACTLRQVARRNLIGECDQNLMLHDAEPPAAADSSWLKENLHIAELFREAIDTAESRRDVAVISYKLARNAQATGDIEQCISWLRHGLSALKPGMNSRRGLVPDLEGALSARMQALLERV